MVAQKGGLRHIRSACGPIDRPHTTVLVHAAEAPWGGPMANLTMPDKEMGSRRFLRFMALAGMDRRQALGQLLLFWDSTRMAGLADVGHADALLHLDGDDAERRRVLAALVACGYVHDAGQGSLHVVGNVAALAYIESRRQRGRAGALKAGRKKLARKRAPKAQSAQAPAAAALAVRPGAGVADARPQVAQAQAMTPFQMACRATWTAYAQAFEHKTGHPPVRNAKVNAQVQQVVKRLGSYDAPHVLRFYVTDITDKAVIESMWSLDLFLKRAEGYATQYKMGRPISQGQAKDMASAAEYYARQRDILDL